MLVSSNNSSSTPTPGSCSSTSNTMEPPSTATPTNTNTNTSSSKSNSSSAAGIQPPAPSAQLLNSPINSINNSRPPSRAPSILDSPTLARVERARLRLEANSQQQQQHMNGSCGSSITTLNCENSLERSILDPKKDATAMTTPWHQVWTHMKRLSHASKVTNSTNNHRRHHQAQTEQKKTLLTTTDIHATTTTTTTAVTAETRNDNIAATTTRTASKSIFVPEKTASLKDSKCAQQVFSRPDMHSLLAGRIPVATMTGPIKRGLLWQQRDRLFSRWKERYFVLTRDYLHCFKRASGSANERASDMGQFIFKVKLVDVEKVEWLNRRSYSAIGLLLGREGRVLLRCDDGLEDWFELLEECTITSKERRRALKIAQGPRSRASLAAPVSHASLQTQHFGLGGNYSSALDDWLMANGSGMGGGRQKLVTNSICGYGGNNPFMFSDSVPDLSALNNENQNHHNGLSTNHSTPQKLPYSMAHNHHYQHSRYSNGYASQQSTLNNTNGFYGSPRRIFINSSFGSNQIVDEEAEDGEVELRRPRIFRNHSTENGNELDRDWLYRKPRPPTDLRHSVQPMLPTHYNTNNISTKLANELDYSGHDSGLDTPPSTHRPSSYREIPLTTNHNHQQQQQQQQQQQRSQQNQLQASPRNSTETSVSSSRGTMLHSPGGSFRAKHSQQHLTNMNQSNAVNCVARFSVQEQQRQVLKMRNEEDRCASIKSGNRTNQIEYYDPNQNRYYKNQHQSTGLSPQHTPIKMAHAANNGNNNSLMNGNMAPSNGSGMFRERYQHPALAAIINEAQGLKFRDRSYSDCQQLPARRNVNNNPSPLTPRRNHINPIFGTPTRV